MMLHTQSVLSGSYSCDDSYAQKHNERENTPKGKEINEPKADQKLVLNAEGGIYFIYLSKIIRIESTNNYCFVHLVSGQSIFISKPLKSFEISLKNNGFYRIHHSHLINLEYLEKLTKDNGNYAIMTNGIRLPVSRRKMPTLMEHIKRSNNFIC